MKRVQTRYTDISPKTRAKVWARDGHRCILCGDPNAGPWCHYIPRSRGGLGVEENVVTLCDYHHRILDIGHGEQRCRVREAVRQYLRSIYDGWEETRLIYRKGM